MYEGFLSYGQNEIANAARAVAYKDALAPQINLKDVLKSDPIPLLTGDESYTDPETDLAPWFDEDDPDTAGFIGVYPVRVRGLDDSTKTATTVEGITDGGFTLEARASTREVLVQAILLGVDEMAVNAGLTWLRAALEPSECAIHGDLCGEVDLSFFAARPTIDESSTNIEAQRLRYWRYVHRADLTADVRVVERRDIANCGHFARVEFAITAGDPKVLSRPERVTLGDVTGPTTIAEPVDDVTNLAPYPSFSEWDTLQTIYTNLATNPSGEVDADGWGTFIQGSSAEGTITTPVVARSGVFPLGRKTIRVTWNQPNAANTEACGLRLNVAVTAGQTYSFRMTGIRSSQRQRLQFSIEWRNASGTLGGTNPPGSSFIAEPGRVYEKTHPPTVAPAGATSVWLRVHSAFGAGQTLWRINSYLEVDGAVVVLGDDLPDYFDGDSKDDIDFVYEWEGARQESRSFKRVRLPLGAIPASQTFDGATGRLSLSQRLGFEGSSARYDWLSNQAVGDTADFGMGGSLDELPVVTPGSTYHGSLYIKSNRYFAGRPVLVWLDGAGDVISTTLGGIASYRRDEYHRVAVKGVAPALAARVAVRFRTISTTGETNSYAPYRRGHLFIIDRAMVTAGANLFPWFDGSTRDTSSFTYSWTGDPGASTSLREIADTTADDLLDPLLPVIPPPPRPPAIPDLALDDITSWKRTARLIPEGFTARWASMFPLLAVNSGATAQRRVRIGFVPNPFGDEPLPDDVVELPQSFIISYLPPYTTLTIDAALGRAWARRAGGDVMAAESLLYGDDGGPIDWPVLRAAGEYIVTVDTPSSPSVTNPTISLFLARQE